MRTSFSRTTAKVVPQPTRCERESGEATENSEHVGGVRNAAMPVGAAIVHIERYESGVPREHPLN
jgi:hypothetical protein